MIATSDKQSSLFVIDYQIIMDDFIFSSKCNVACPCLIELMTYFSIACQNCCNEWLLEFKRGKFQGLQCFKFLICVEFKYHFIRKRTKSFNLHKLLFRFGLIFVDYNVIHFYELFGWIISNFQCNRSCRNIGSILYYTYCQVPIFLMTR